MMEWCRTGMLCRRNSAAWIKTGLMAAFMGLTLSFTGMIAGQAANTAVKDTEPETIRVSLYPYVPDIQPFKTVLEKQWKEIEPNISIEFVDWDCYVEQPRDDIDVFVFDATFFPSYFKEGALYPMGASIPDENEYPEWLQGPAKSNGAYYGIPQMVCMDTLFYRSDDKAMENVHTMEDLYQVIGPRKTEKQLPDGDEGLITDFSPVSGNPLKYYNILQDHYQELVPEKAMNAMDNESLHYLKQWFTMTVKETGFYASDYEFTRAEWFAEGHGRALYAYPESFHEIARLGQGKNVEIKTISSCEHPDFATSYVDYVGISSHIAPNKVNAARKMAALLTSQNYMREVLWPENKNETPQYLLAARQDVMKELAEKDNIYRKIYDNLYNRTDLHVMTGTVDFPQWEEKIDPSVEAALQEAAADNIEKSNR
jgi:thiamine pyridinylase